MLKEFIFTMLAAIYFAQVGFAQSSGVFTDYRDGQTYTTISIKDTSTGSTVTWMAQNLNYKMQGTYAYDDNESNREEFGLLYSWEAAKEACPSGWHLATDAEWAMLVNEFGGIDTAAKALKSVEGWSEDGNGDNSSGFNGLPAGILRRNGFNDGYAVLGFLGFWWSATSADESTAWAWNMHYGGPATDKPLKAKVFRFNANVSNAVSVRCVRNLQPHTAESK